MRIYFMTNLTNHKALITGASRGIGVANALLELSEIPDRIQILKPLLDK